MNYEEIEGVEIFSVGEHVDSAGNKRSWTDDELIAIQAGLGKTAYEPALKLGHSEEQELARRIAGGQVGDMPRLGTVKRLALKAGKLIADFTQVPEKVVQMWREGAWKHVSAEIYERYQFPDGTISPALRAVALLGTQPPALKELAALYSEGTYLAYYPADYQPVAMTKNQEEKSMAENKETPQGAGTPATFSQSDVEKMIREKLAEQEGRFQAELQRRERIAAFAEELRGAGPDGSLPVKALQEAGLGELAELLSNAQPVKFADGKTATGLSLLQAVIRQAAKAGYVKPEIVANHQESQPTTPQGLNDIHQALAVKQHAENLKRDPNASFWTAQRETYSAAVELERASRRVM